jgi:hypothetical protein
VADPELEVHRGAGGPVLGQGPLSVIDNLTMLYTRRYLHEVANAEAQRVEVQSTPFGVVLVDLAGIAEVNRLRGYAAGDDEIRARRGAPDDCRPAAGHRVPLQRKPPPAPHSRQRRGGHRTSRGRGRRRLAVAWRPGDSGDAVVARARAGLD